MSTLRLTPVVCLCAFLAVVSAPSQPAFGSTMVQLDDLNSHVEFETDSGQTVWIVDKVSQLKQQWFYYRLDGMTEELPLSGLGYFNHKAVDANFNPGDDTLTVIYGQPAGFSVTLAYLLNGGLDGTLKSDLVETISFHNLTGQPVHLQFFQYCDFDLGGTSGGDTVEIVNPNAVRQSDALIMVAETVLTPVPTRTEVGVYDSTLLKLNDEFADMLDNTTGPIGPDDVTWAFQWDLTVPVGGTVQISKDKNITPEPATLALMGLGGLGLVLSRKRR
ncbi:MAG TPA: PEP-CTERM sorting domain-containing protein [Phycisphaerae bacterium]|nr:PEP-CTERM sorting domain-containing protein [Phycisphaerae bacterium]